MHLFDNMYSILQNISSAVGKCVFSCSVGYLWLLFSCQVLSNSLQPHGVQHIRLPFPHHLLELAQVHAQWICDANQPSHPLLPSSNCFIELFMDSVLLLIFCLVFLPITEGRTLKSPAIIVEWSVAQFSHGLLCIFWSPDVWGISP